MHGGAPSPDPRPRPAHVIVGVDPGLRRTGFAVLRLGPQGPILCEAGLVRVTAAGPLEARLAELERELEAVLSGERPTILACEQLYAHYKHPRTAILMGHARGVILALAARRGMAVISLAATHVKKLLTGSGRASKAQMQRAVAATLGLVRPPAPHDVADAIAIALAGARQASRESTDFTDYTDSEDHRGLTRGIAGPGRGVWAQPSGARRGARGLAARGDGE